MLKNYKIFSQKIDNHLDKFTDRFKSKVKNMIDYSLNGGKRLRSVIPLVINQKLNPKIDISKFAMSIELFHTCSLIIDDMPCMDNDKLRRNQLTIHHKYGECKAQILVSLLLKEANNLIFENINQLKVNKKSNLNNEQLDNISIYLFQCISDNLGLLGASMGQFFDTAPINNNLEKSDYEKYYDTIDKLLNLVHLKTTTFFEISFIGAYLLSGGDMKHIDDIKKAVKYFGLAFQISDDFEDYQQDKKRMKLNLFNPNLVCKYGRVKGKQIYESSKKKFYEIMNKLKINDIIFQEIFEFLDKRI